MSHSLLSTYHTLITCRAAALEDRSSTPVGLGRVKRGKDQNRGQQWANNQQPQIWNFSSTARNLLTKRREHTLQEKKNRSFSRLNQAKLEKRTSLTRASPNYKPHQMVRFEAWSLKQRKWSPPELKPAAGSTIEGLDSWKRYLSFCIIICYYLFTVLQSLMIYVTLWNNNP